MAGRIRKVWRTPGRLLAGAAALAAVACGSAEPTTLTDQSGTPTPEATSPSPSESGSPSGSPTPSPTPSPSRSRRPRRSPTPLPPSPTSSQTPPPTATPTPHVVVGRPLRRRRRLLAPVARRDAEAPIHPDHERLAELPSSLREELGRLWLGAARMEHASVPAFAEIALLLAAVGAPLDLVEAAHRAALDEVEHTRLSYGLANAYLGAAHGPGGLRRLLGRRLGSRLRGQRGALRRLAVEALRDGCLIEGYAGALAAAGASSATDPAPREALERIARDETSHAELSWRLLGWCLNAGGSDVRPGVERALRALPVSAAPPTPSAVLGEHGWPDPDQAAAIFAALRDEVVERATGLLSL